MPGHDGNEAAHYFENVGLPSKIPFEGAASKNPLAFKYYNESQMVQGKSMRDWLRFSVCYWHTMRGVGADPFGGGTIGRPWEDGTDSLDNALRRLRVAFEFMKRLGVPFWTFHDRDIAPEGATLAESNKLLDAVVDLAEELQVSTGITCLWGTANLFSTKRYMNGASTNPDAHVFAYAAAQVKKVMEVTLRLGGQCLVFWGGREGYQSLLNTDVKQELDHMAAFFKMVVAYKAKIGATYQLLIEPKPKEPSAHQYDYDAQTVICFLKSYGLEKDFKINIEPNHTTLAGHCAEHDIVVAGQYGMLGSIDANTGVPHLGWDTDCFMSDTQQTTLIMKTVLEQGGIAPGGLNFDAKVRRESTSLEDMFIAHILGMDAFAKGLLGAAALLEDGVLPAMVSKRYASYTEGFGKKLAEGKATLEECEAYVMEHGEPTQISGSQEKYQSIFNTYT